MKIFKHRNIMGTIYMLMLAIPMCYLLVSCAYVIINKNAFNSFNDQTIMVDILNDSIEKIIGSANFGLINFMSWFESLFLDMTNSVNALYIHFINWYLNYVMFVSCAYLLFLVLMWFINFSRKLLERGMNYDW